MKERPINQNVSVPEIAGGSGELDFKPAEEVNGRVVPNKITPEMHMRMAIEPLKRAETVSRGMRRGRNLSIRF